MSDNIKRAVAAIQAEIKHAKQGMAHYEKQVVSLEGALAQLGGIGQVGPVKAKRGRKPKAEAVETKPTKGRGRKGRDLPFTGGDFWESLITAKPQSASDVLKAAPIKLGITPDKAQIKKLQSRMVFALNALVKAGTIKDSGKGRDRRFFVK